MMFVKVGDAYPMPAGAHRSHRAVVTSVDTHGIPTWELGPGAEPPTLTIVCSCGTMFATTLDEAVVAA